MYALLPTICLVASIHSTSLTRRGLAPTGKQRLTAA